MINYFPAFVLARNYTYHPQLINQLWHLSTYKTTKLKYGKLPSKLAEEIPWNKLCVYIIGPYVKRRKGKKENLHLKYVTMINPVTGWFEIVQYDDKIAITIANLVKTMWLSRYPRPIEIAYDQGEAFIGHKFINSSIGMFLNSWPINYDPWSYVISISIGYLDRHLVSTNFEIYIALFIILQYFKPSCYRMDNCNGF